MRGTDAPSIAPETAPGAAAAGAVHGPLGAQLMQQVSFNMLFRWFVGLSMDAPVWDVTVFAKNRDRLLAGDAVASWLRSSADPAVKRLLSTDHFSVDGTLIDAWASMKSFRRKDGSDDPSAPGRNAEREFRGDKRSNARLGHRPGRPTVSPKSSGASATLCYMGHAVIENRNGLVVATEEVARASPAHRRARGSHRDGRGSTWQSAHHAGRRQGLRHGQLVAEMRRLGVTHMSRRTPKAGGRRSMAAPRAIPATRSACAGASASRKCSAGSRRQVVCARRGMAGNRAGRLGVHLGCGSVQDWCRDPQADCRGVMMPRSLSRGMRIADPGSTAKIHKLTANRKPLPNASTTREYANFARISPQPVRGLRSSFDIWMMPPTTAPTGLMEPPMIDAHGRRSCLYQCEVAPESS